MSEMSKSKKIGVPSKPKVNKRTTFYQTDVSAHEAWAHLTLACPRAAGLMHFLVARMDRNTNAVVASHSTLAKMMGSSNRSIKNWLTVLAKGKWLQQVSLGPGSMNAYVVNSVVAWGVKREHLQMASFTAQVLALKSDQDKVTIDCDLRKLPVLFPGDQQLPVGPSDEPPSQGIMDGMEPDLPAIPAEGLDD